MQSLLQTHIPAGKLAAVEKALLETFNTAEVTDIALLAGGLSASVVYRIVINAQQFVLKLDTPKPAGNATTQPTCVEIAANAGIAPPIYYLSTADALSVTGLIETKPLRTVFTTTDILLPALAKTIKSIHAMPPFPKEHNLLDMVDGLIRQFRASKMFPENAFKECLGYYEMIRENYPWQDTDKVPSHNDLNPNNILCDGEKIWIIDWDAAFQNDRYVDLAIIANTFVNNETEEQLLLETYFGNTPTSYQSSRFFLMQQICRIVYAMLMFKLAHTSNPATIAAHDDEETINLRELRAQIATGKLQLSSHQGQLAYGKALLNEALGNMRSPRFAASIKQLA